MSSSTTKAAFWQGLRDGAPFLLVVVPFSVLFGVLATEAGLNLVQAMAFSIVVFGGAAQFTALQLMVDNVPTAIVVISSLAVNLRVAMYSASLTPYIGGAPVWQRALAAYFIVDQTYASSIAKYEAEPEMPVPQRIAYFFGVVVPICPAWYVFTVVGAVVGGQISPEYALDFALPITFLALIAPMLRTAAHVAAALVAIVASLVCATIPYNLGLIIAGTAGMMVGAQVELWSTKRTNGQ
ncbi:MAG: AzlC family ABC transporter permease [Paracoccaceae bacterium]